jgi:hypothetical protein
MRRPSEVFQQKIWPAYVEYLDQPANIRLANIVALAVNDNLEWTYQYYKAGDVSRLHGAATLKQFRDVVFGLCPELIMMKDLADADKHRVLRPGARRILAVSSRAYSKRNGRLWVTGYEKPFQSAAQAAVQFWKERAD